MSHSYLWLISLPFLLYFFNRLRKRKPLTLEERVLAWLGIIVIIVGVGFQVIEWLGITPAFLIPYASSIVYSLVLVGSIAIALFVGRRTKKPQTIQGIETIGREATKPASPRRVESGTEFIPREGEPIILESKLLAGIDFFPSREDLPPLNTFLRSAEHSVDVLALSAETIILSHPDILTQLLREGKHLRFILLDPSSDELTSKLNDFGSPVTNKKQREVALQALEVMKTQLSDVERGRLDIRTYDLSPIHNIVIIDAQSENAVLNVEFFVYGNKPRSWLSLRIHKNQQPELFKKYWDSYEFAHERSTEWGG